MGQFNEVEVPGFDSGKINEQTWQELVSDFHQLHDERYGYALPQGEVELINLRLVANGKTAKPGARQLPLVGEDASHALKKQRQAWFDNRMQAVDVYDALALQAGNRVRGPAIVEQATTTIVLPAGAELRCDEWGNYLVEIVS